MSPGSFFILEEMNMLKVRKSLKMSRESRWVADDTVCPSYINEQGELGIYYDYATEIEARAALDLYLEKQNPAAKQGKVKTLNIKIQHGHPRFYKLLKEMAELHSRKNHDYAGVSDPLKNLRACERLELKPFMGVMVRLQDKWSRLEEFIKSGELMVKNESVKDTLMDNAVYSILAIILYEEEEDY